MADSFSRIVDLGDFLQKDLQALMPAEVAKLHAQAARAIKAEEISANRLRETDVQTIVDGRTPASEDSVKPFGVIAYQFGSIASIAIEIRDWLRDRSPVDSGKFRDSWFPLLNGAPANWESLAEAHRPGQEIWITNDQPYARVIEVGHGLNAKVGHNIVDKAAVWANRQFANSLTARVVFIELHQGGSGRATEVPWILRKSGGRKDRQAGMAITYPALVLRAR